MQDIVFHAAALEFRNYHIGLASVFEEPMLDARGIFEVRLRRWPLEVVTARGEVLFVPNAQQDDLRAFAGANDIPVVVREDVWCLLNDCYLDTEFTAEYKMAALLELRACGFSAEDIAAIHEKTARKMMARHSWAWMHLGHEDILTAFGWDRRAANFDDDAKALYDEFNGISNRGRLVERLPGMDMQ
jgi:hypothetical protein